MGLFSRKEKNNEYLQAQQQMNQVEVKKSSEIIFFDEITGDDSKTTNYVDKIKDGIPLVLNFERVDVATANKVLAFLAGAVYALGGKTIRIDEKIYLFALNKLFLDGSLDKWLKDLKNQ